MSDRVAELSLRYDPFQDADRDVDIKMRTVSIVNTRKEHDCLGPDGVSHQIPAGTKARFESALVDGRWGSYYICLSCMAEWLKERRLLEGS